MKDELRLAYGPMMRWWIPAAMVDEAEIRKEMLEARNAGFAGLELCVNMADTKPTEEELETNGWATGRWNALYRTILQYANQIGLRIDTTLTPAWPPAILGITPEAPEASKELSVCAVEPFRGSYRGMLPMETLSITDGYVGNRNAPPPPGPPGSEAPLELPNRPVLQAVIAARIAADIPVTRQQSINWGDMPLITEEKTRMTKLLDAASLTLLKTVPGQQEISFTAPDDGTWIIFAAWMRGTEQQNKQGRATKDPCLVVDHFGDAGADALIRFWETQLLDEEIRSLLKENGGSFFEDSMEVSTSDGCFHWSHDLLDRFSDARGYDLRPYIPLLHGITCGGMSNVDFYTFELSDGSDGISPIGDQVRRDFKQTITEGFACHHIERIQNWAKTLNQGFRCQCYSGIHDTAFCSAVCVGPEGESLGFGPDVQGDDRFRIVAGGAHMNFRNEITDEVGALANKGYRLTWKYMLQWINKNYCGGANRMIFHGYPYSDSQCSLWPGYSPFGFGLGGYWGSREPGWQHMTDFTAYLTHVQELLHQGKPCMDFAILSHKYGTNAPILKDQSAAQLGYTYDVITPSVLQLPGVVLRNGRLCPDGPGYRAVVLLHERAMPLHTVEQLAALSDAGFPVILCGECLTEKSEYADDAAAFQKAAAHVKAAAIHIPDETALAAALEGLSIRHPFRTRQTVAVIHRSTPDTELYGLLNYGSSPVSTTVTMDGYGSAARYRLWAPEDTAPKEHISDNNTWTLSLAPGEFRMYSIAEDNAGLPEAMEPGQAFISIENASLAIDRYENAHNPLRSSDTKRSIADFGLQPFKAWNSLEAVPCEISGVAHYTADFAWDQGPDGILMIDRAYYCSIRVRVNGNPVPFDLYTGTAAICGKLIRGTNRLELELSGTLGNQLIADGTIAAPVWCPEMKPEPEPFGIHGPIRIYAAEAAE